MPAAGLKSYVVKCCLTGRRGVARGGRRWKNPPRIRGAAVELGAACPCCPQALDPSLSFCQGESPSALVYLLPMVGTLLRLRTAVGVEMHSAAVPGVRAYPLVEVFSSPLKVRRLMSAALYL